MGMEPAAAWGPSSEFQLANWITVEEPTAEVWAPAVGLPLEYVSSDISGTCCSLQAHVPESIGEQQLVEYNYAASRHNWSPEAVVSVGRSAASRQIVEYAAATHHDPIENAAKEFEVDIAQEFEVDMHNMEMKISNPIGVFEKTAHEFNVDIDMVAKKIHRYPTMIRALGDRYTRPTLVAIGPYHRHRSQLNAAEKLKHVAAYHCIRESGHTVQEMYDAVVAAADDVRSLYDKSIIGITDDDYLPMMFYDACFLVQFMISCTDDGCEEMDHSLGTFLDANYEEILHDIMLLENQIPWRVVEAVMRFRPVDLKDFVASLKGCLQDRKVPEEKPFELDDSYEPPHLLGLLRYYIVGRSNGYQKPLKETGEISFSVSAMELSEIGIKLKANNTTEIIHMGIKKDTLFAELAMSPLSLDNTRACLLVNMAAHELRTTLIFPEAEDEDSAVCSYLLLFAMFVDREEDVHELRTKRLLQGGGGLTNSEALKFFTSLQGLRLGSGYYRIMREIEDYKAKRQVRIKGHAFVYKNMKTIIAVISAISALAGIIGSLAALKGN